MAKLQVGRDDGKKGSKKAVLWNQAGTESFDKLKHELAQELSFFKPYFEKPYIFGAVLAQIIDGKEQPAGFYSRKSASSQLNWAAKEKEMFAEVAALLKWSGVINFQPVLVTTDHRALEH